MKPAHTVKRALAAQSTNSAVRTSHASVSPACVCHSPSPLSLQNCLTLSSNLIHLRLDGRLGRNDPKSATAACQEESRQAVTLVIHSSIFAFAARDAHRHFLRKCSGTHSLTAEVRANRRALSVARFTHSTHCSSHL